MMQNFEGLHNLTMLVQYNNYVSLAGLKPIMFGLSVYNHKISTTSYCSMVVIRKTPLVVLLCYDQK
jgi:hypothetical protein